MPKASSPLETRNPAALAGAHGADRKAKSNTADLTPRTGRVQPKAAVAARDHYRIELYVGRGWCCTHSRLGEASRVILGLTFPAALRRFRELPLDALPAVVVGGDA